MQLTDTSNSRLAKEDKQGRIMPVGETVSLAAIGKWLVGLILAPWLWYERKRVDKLKDDLALNHFNKTETKDLIDNKTDVLHRDVTEIKETMKVMSETLITSSVTIARIDERSKRRDNG